MPGKPKHEANSDKQAKEEKTRAENPETDEKGTWSEDQREKSYYYDDSYGYEIYNPDEDDDE